MRILIRILIAKMRILIATRCRKCSIFCMTKRSISLTEQKQNDKAKAISQTYVVENSSILSFSDFDYSMSFD